MKFILWSNFIELPTIRKIHILKWPECRLTSITQCISSHRLQYFTRFNFTRFVRWISDLCFRKPSVTYERLSFSKFSFIKIINVVISVAKRCVCFKKRFSLHVSLCEFIYRCKSFVTWFDGGEFFARLGSKKQVTPISWHWLLPNIQTVNGRTSASRKLWQRLNKKGDWTAVHNQSLAIRSSYASMWFLGQKHNHFEFQTSNYIKLWNS